MNQDNRTHPHVPATGSRSSIAHFFDEMAGKRNAVFQSNPVLDYEQRVRSEVVLQMVAAKRGETILDIGCGNARDIVPMLQADARVIGVDLSDGMIEQARLELAAAGHAGLELQVGDATNLEFPAGTFDKIVCSEVIEHIPDARKAVREMQRTLRSGGMLVMSTPNRRSWYGFDRYVLWRWIFRRTWNHPFDEWRTRPELCALLEGNGFLVTRAATVCYLPGFLLTYFLPPRLQAVVVWFVRRGELLARRLAPGLGYMLVVTAVKKS